MKMVFNRLRYGAVLATLLVATLILNGCGGGGSSATITEDELTKMITDSLESWSEKSEASIDVQIAGDLNMNNQEMQSGNGTIDFTVEFKKSEDEKADWFAGLAAALKTNAGEAFDVDVNALFLNSNFFVKLNTVPAQFSMFVPAEFKSNWIAVPADFRDSVDENLDMISAFNFLAEPEDSEELQELFHNTQFIEKIKNKGTVKRNSKKLQSYHAVYDTDAILDYSIESARLSGEPLDEEEIEMARKVLKDTDLDVSFFFDGEELFALTVNIKANMNDKENDTKLTAKFTVDIDLDTSITKSNFEEPADVVKF